MADYFGEKSRQVEPGTLTAFGMEIFSRYGIAHEIAEMMEFAEACAKNEVEHYVTKVFYDSKATICNFEFAEALADKGYAKDLILGAAKDTIGQFLWDGTSHLGGRLATLESAPNGCVACGGESKFSIILAVGVDGNDSKKDRYYFPNQMVRSESPRNSPAREIGFCADCIRKLEDNFRGTLLYIQKEKGVVKAV